MKIENNGISPLAPKKTDSTQRVDRQASSGDGVPSVGKRDKAEVSEGARILAKARTALEHSSEVESDKVAEIRQQVQNGDYTIQVEEIAKRLMKGVFSNRT